MAETVTHDIFWRALYDSLAEDGYFARLSDKDLSLLTDELVAEARRRGHEIFSAQQGFYAAGVADRFGPELEVYGKVHRTKSGRVPTASRNRSKYVTACGRTLRVALPTATDHRNAACRKCFP